MSLVVIHFDSIEKTKNGATNLELYSLYPLTLIYFIQAILNSLCKSYSELLNSCFCS